MFHHIQYVCPDDTGYLFTFNCFDPFFRYDHTVFLPVDFFRHKISENISAGDDFICRFLGDIVHSDRKLVRSSFNVNCYCTPFHNKQLKGCYYGLFHSRIKSWRESVDILLATAWRGYAATVAVHCITYNRFFYASLHRLLTPARIRLHNLTFNGLVIKADNLCRTKYLPVYCYW